MKIQIDQKDFELMIEHEQVKKRLRLIGIQLNVAYENRIPVFVGVLNGCFMFMADLMKEVHIASEVCFVKMASYQGDQREEEVKNLIGLSHPLKGREVVIVEDIVDTGNTLKKVIALIAEEEPASIAVCTLLLKPDALEHDFEEIAYVGFEIENQFVVGYGLDYNGIGRNLKDIYRAI
ncbi:hypoxanthine phosphoribosyltransferase [Olivibacter jilunii]|jgi:hypoxanthine phosphoribosyltransferase|uniref:hypoxanthine phosphoribosyltransferase n=1 Tax=Olivibacter jilunii TaxID=985016 RepID=UPI003F157F90